MSAWGPAGLDAVGPSDFDYDHEVEISKWVSSVTWLKSVQSPWESIQLTLRVSRKNWSTFFPGHRNDDPAKKQNTSRQPGVGWWVTVKLAQPLKTKGNVPVTIAWGRVESIRFTMRPGQVGHVETDRVEIVCGSWMNLVANSRVILAAGSVQGEKGFVYGMRQWSRFMRTFMRSLKTHKPGKLFDKLWRTMVKVRIPPALSGGKTDALIGEQIPVIWNADMCDKFIPTRSHQQLDIHGYAINAFGSSRGPNGSLLQLFRGAFGADQNLTEFFPTIDYPWRRQEADKAPYQTAVGRALNAQPVLMYRMRPWLLEPINKKSREAQMAQRNKSGEQEGFEYMKAPSTASERRKVNLFQKATPYHAGQSGDVTFTEEEADDNVPLSGLEAEILGMTHTPDDIYAFDYMHKDSDRINGIYVQTPMQPNTTMQMHGGFGQPMLNLHDARKNGLRMYDIDWPMFPATASGSAELLKHKLNAVVEVGGEFFAQGEAFASGTAELRYKPWLTPGTWQSFTPAYSEGTTGGLRIIAYVETVITKFEVSDVGKIRARTTVQFIRGHVAMDVKSTSKEEDPFGFATVTLWGEGKLNKKAKDVIATTDMSLTNLDRKTRELTSPKPPKPPKVLDETEKDLLKKQNPDTSDQEEDE